MTIQIPVSILVQLKICKYLGEEITDPFGGEKGEHEWETKNN